MKIWINFKREEKKRENLRKRKKKRYNIITQQGELHCTRK